MCGRDEEGGENVSTIVVGIKGISWWRLRKGLKTLLLQITTELLQDGETIKQVEREGVLRSGCFFRHSAPIFAGNK